MSEFLLLGTRPPMYGEISLDGASHDLVALTTWHRWLRRWGVLRAFALSRDPGAELQVCLVVQASGHVAAWRLAAGWGHVGGYRVSVLPLSGWGR
jgi:hypothetical protein